MYMREYRSDIEWVVSEEYDDERNEQRNEMMNEIQSVEKIISDIEHRIDR